MASNSFGNIFRVTTWGESHGKAIGVVIDGCPAGVAISEEEIFQELARRSPGKEWTSPRKEKDYPEIYSGVFQGITTGHPISILIKNSDVDSTSYEAVKDVLRPGHAHFTYLEKYGVFDYRGGGRASARETACRVAAGAVAKKILKMQGIQIGAYLQQLGEVTAEIDFVTVLQEPNAPLFCPDGKVREEMQAVLEKVLREGDSIGGAVAFFANGVPIGLGDPVYEKLHANLGKLLFSIPAVKAVEFGRGVEVSSMQGSLHNDPLILKEKELAFVKNDAGGLLGGITTGEPLCGRVYFKPASSIKKEQKTLNLKKEEICYSLPKEARHDPCVAIRGVPVVEACVALALVDAYLMHRCSKI